VDELARRIIAWRLDAYCFENSSSDGTGTFSRSLQAPSTPRGIHGAGPRMSIDHQTRTHDLCPSCPGCPDLALTLHWVGWNTLMSIGFRLTFVAVHPWRPRRSLRGYNIGYISRAGREMAQTWAKNPTDTGLSKCHRPPSMQGRVWGGVCQKLVDGLSGSTCC